MKYAETNVLLVFFEYQLDKPTIAFKVG